MATQHDSRCGKSIQSNPLATRAYTLDSLDQDRPDDSAVRSDESEAEMSDSESRSSDEEDSMSSRSEESEPDEPSGDLEMDMHTASPTYPATVPSTTNEERTTPTPAVFLPDRAIGTGSEGEERTEATDGVNQSAQPSPSTASPPLPHIASTSRQHGQCSSFVSISSLDPTSSISSLDPTSAHPQPSSAATDETTLGEHRSKSHS